MQQFELDYANMLRDIAENGDLRDTRNGLTRSLFGMHLEINMSGNHFPILQGRKMYPKGVFGELAAMLRRPACVQDFELWGCNYWEKWADKDGKLNLDYGNTWFDFNGVNQIKQLKQSLANNPTDRRMIITSWKPDGMEDLSLPCCHYGYQFYVRNGKLDMMWIQRSVDMMIGLPSDIVFAAAWLIAIANEFGLEAGKITMSLGDCHIYAEHVCNLYTYLDNVDKDIDGNAPTYIYNAPKGADFCTFKPADLHLSIFRTYPAIKLELKA